ncbi:helix-turn-helix domain-containing protein, partial [Hymenobacter sp. IS2118]|uniref:helix-turn-helix domain-containing protein n=1 Tax=Hymenobacter sp. IS2118 TaxID=1505605 RepID=UPI00054D00F2
MRVILPRAGTLPALRRYLNLSQADLAHLLGINRVRVTEAEAGTRFLTAEARDALSALLAALPLATRQALAGDPGHAAPPLPP